MMVVILWSCTLFKIDRQMGRIKDLKEEPAPHVDAGFFRQVYGERSMFLSR